ncbi:MAG TPA: YhjD/YihY/BrkB family envelope integrity protein [Solirubrobacteraceae bacterium]|jgi:YihY family inner membrane protein|nr:YhjD/YihY/BrkB family envelope integrity protein [Solirubrobacteraceae bacterium]
MSLIDGLRRFDRLQQRRRGLGFAIAVIKKFADDQAGQLAGLMAYYAFLSLFPLLLVFVTALGFALQGDPGLQRSIESSAFSHIPVLGTTIRHNVGSLHGSGLALGLGTLLALWAGLGVTQAAQSAFNRVWNVPFRQRPDFLRSRLRGLFVLLLLGGLIVVSTGLTALAHSTEVASLSGLWGHVISAVVNVLLFVTAFRLLTAQQVAMRELVPGIVLAAAFWQLLAELGTSLISTKLRYASDLYGTFGLVIGLIAALYLAAQLTMLAAEINVVRARRLWPRSLFAPLIEGDRRALRSSATVEERVDQERVTVTFSSG